MISAPQATKTETARTTAVIATGVDSGAGLVKMCLGAERKIRQPSKVVEIHEDLHDELTSATGGHFYYHSGSRPELEGREFLTGSTAALKAPTSHVKLSDNPALKVEYALHMILGGLASLPYQPEWNLHLVLSIHNAKMFNKALATKTSGTHIISVGKNAESTKVKLNVSLVVPEGVGSYAYCTTQSPRLIDNTGTAIAYDFGTATVIPTVFDAGGKIIHRKVLEVGGCIALLDLIAADQELGKVLATGRVGNVETIRQGIESAKFQYGTTPFNFRSIYVKHVKIWLADRVRLALKETDEWQENAQSLVAWGGGVEMQGVSQMLATHGITGLKDGCWSNAIGLQLIAAGRLAGGK